MNLKKKEKKLYFLKIDVCKCPKIKMKPAFECFKETVSNKITTKEIYSEK